MTECPPPLMTAGEQHRRQDAALLERRRDPRGDVARAVVTRDASSAVTRAQTRPGSSLRTILSSRPPVTHATPGCEANSAASWPAAASQPRTGASFSVASLSVGVIGPPFR
jgi:hypothetical protein